MRETLDNFDCVPLFGPLRFTYGDYTNISVDLLLLAGG